MWLAWNIQPCWGLWKVSLSDGAYPRPEGRGIAPVQRITDSQLCDPLADLGKVVAARARER